MRHPSKQRHARKRNTPRHKSPVTIAQQAHKVRRYGYRGNVVTWANGRIVSVRETYPSNASRQYASLPAALVERVERHMKGR